MNNIEPKTKEIITDEDIEKAPKELKSLKDLLNYYKSLK